jgi:hypothetical protein
VNALERTLEKTGDRFWLRFRKRPYVGALVAGGLGLGVASVVGVGELAIAAGTAYAAYQVLKNRDSPAQAVRDAFRIERELLD